jgi:biotin operon repressor
MSDRTTSVLATFRQLNLLGVPKTRIAQELGISRQTLEYHIKKGKARGTDMPTGTTVTTEDASEVA